MNEQVTELIQDLLSIYFTKREQPNVFEVDTVERAIELVGDKFESQATLESYKYWIEKHRVDE